MLSDRGVELNSTALICNCVSRNNIVKILKVLEITKTKTSLSIS